MKKEIQRLACSRHLTIPDVLKGLDLSVTLSRNIQENIKTFARVFGQTTKAALDFGDVPLAEHYLAYLDAKELRTRFRGFFGVVTLILSVALFVVFLLSTRFQRVISDAK